MMTNTPIRIAVTGVTGRMGKEIIQYISNRKKQGFDNKIILGAVITGRSNSMISGMDSGVFINSHANGIIITNNIELVKKDFDILIDFTAPNLTIEYLKFCIKNQKSMIIGTTGFSQIDLNIIKNASKKIGIVYSPNFSIGITVMLNLLKKAAKIIGNFVNIDIIEVHHNKKKDIPSGTALMIRDLLDKSIVKTDAYDEIKYSFLNNNNIFQENMLSSIINRDIMIHSIRSGDIIGEHTVLFSSEGERLEIIHKASSRKIFAHGALCSAIWMGNIKKIGLFDLNDVLGCNV